MNRQSQPMMHQHRYLWAGWLALVLACSGPAATKAGPTGPESDPASAATTVAAATAKAATRPLVEAEPPIPELQFPQGEAFRKEQPKAGAPRALQLPRIAQFKLRNGLQVYLVEQHALPTISVDLNFDGGSIADPKGKEGLASVCMAMLTEGTEKLDKLAFKGALADTASRISSYSRGDNLGVRMRTLSKHLTSTHALLVDTLRTPGLRESDLKRMLDRRVAALEQAKGTAGRVASRINGRVLYGPNHPRGRVVTEASYRSITVDDCRAFHKKHIKPRGGRLFVVGDLTADQIRAHFDTGLPGWQGKGARLPRQPTPRTQKGRIFFVDIPKAAQSAVYVMHFGPKRKARDYMATRVMSSVLGGHFTGRINMNLREDKGYSYGAGGGMQYNRDHGIFYLASSVRSDSTYQTVKEMMGEMSGLQDGSRPATDEDLAREKDGAILKLPGDFATSRQALSRFRGLVYHRLPMNYYDSFVDRIAKVTPAQVAAAAKKHLRPENAIVIVVGDRNAPLIHRVAGKDEPLLRDGAQMTLLEGLQDLLQSGILGKGKLVELDVDGNPVAKK